jgi:catechol 2,3-dioxygenase-like lactoylglutathione lyase family enzyme
MTAPSDEVGDLRLATVVVNVSDMSRAVRFWCDALGYRPREAHQDPEFTMLEDPRGDGLPLSLQLTDEPHRQPVRLHLDLYTDEQSRHVQRLIRLGATEAPDWPYPDDPDFVVLRDPDGNEFCVIDHVELTGGSASANG